MTRRLGIFAFSLVVLLSMAAVGARMRHAPAAPAQTAQGPALVTNGSFEEMDGAVPRGWKSASFQRGAQFSVGTVAHTGTKSAQISSATGADAAWTTVVRVRPYSKYRLTGWIRTERVEGNGKGALLNIHGIEALQTTPVRGTQEWTKVELTIDTAGNDALQVNCLLGGWGKTTGTAWFDDIALELLSTTDLKPAVQMDVARTREPMSKYIYGQFIEHLGRCIYGGIWAEMLEDRKFFYDVGAKESPWVAVGGASAVTMTKQAPFVGAHTPEIALPGGTAAGIEQGELALLANKKYVGRVVIAGDATAAPVTVSLVWGPGEADRQSIVVKSVGGTYQTTPLAFTAAAATEHGRLVIISRGAGTLRVGTASLMPADNVEGFRPDTLQLLRELNSPVYRWPGGNFVSGYDWHDGIGDRDKRPPRKNPAWTGVEHNDVGLHEFMALCRLIDTEPYIAVNAGLGGVEAAAAEVEYVNGAATTPMGQQRAKNGHPEPYRCRFWSIGNEMYGDWQLGHMPLKDYVQKHNAFADAMRAKDPKIELIGVGAVGEWSEAMLTSCADHMSLMSEHFYCQEAPGLLSHVSQIPREIRQIADAHRKYRKTIPALAGKNVRVALDEWNYWYGPHLYGELGTQYFLKDALGIAAGIHEYSRNTDIIFMANYAQTVNVIGAIKTSKTAATLDTTGLVLKLYRQRFGQIPVELAGKPEPLDVAAAWRENGRALTISIVNPTASEQQLSLAVTGVTLPSAARAWRIAGTDERAHNVPGGPTQVRIEERASEPFDRVVTVPPMSATLYELAVTRPAAK